MWVEVEIAKHGGALSFHDFMELALYHPRHGYYSSGRPRYGRGGDYLTAPTASAWYAAGDKRPRPFDWTADLPSVAPELDPAQVTAWQRMLANYRENLLIPSTRTVTTSTRPLPRS